MRFAIALFLSAVGLSGTSAQTGVPPQSSAEPCPACYVFANTFSGADAGERISNAIASLPASGGTVDARGLIEEQTISSDVFSSVTEPVTLILGAARYIITANVTIPANFTIQFGQGAVLLPARGVNTIINGSITAGPMQQIVATGAAGVVSFRHAPDGIYFAWYGAKGDDEADDTTAVQTAINSAPDFSLIRVPPGFRMKQTRTIKLYQRLGLKIIADESTGNSVGTAGSTSAAGLAWFGASGGTMLQLDRCQQLHIEGLNFWMQGANAGKNAPNVAIDSDELSSKGNLINTDNWFDRDAISIQTGNARLQAIRISNVSRQNVENQHFRRIRINCGNSGVAFYVGPSSNAIDIDFKDGAVSNCGTAFYLAGGQEILLDNNVLDNRHELYTAQATYNVTFSNSRTENSTAPTIHAQGNGLILKNNQFCAVQGSGPDIFLDVTASRLELINNYWDSNSSIASISPGAHAIVFSSQNSWPNCNVGSGIPDWTAFNQPISDNLDNCTRTVGAFGTGPITTVFNTRQFTVQPPGIASGSSYITPPLFNLSSGNSMIGSAPSSSGIFFRIASGTLMDTVTPNHGTATTSTYAGIGIPTLRADHTGVTTTDANTTSILGAPVPASNQTVINTTALNIATNDVAAQGFHPRNSYGLRVMAQTGAINNVAAKIMGALQLTTTGTRPACTVALRGAAWFVESPPGKADIYQICSKGANDTYGWVTH